MDEHILNIENLKTWFPVLGGVLRRPIAQIHAVDGVDLDVRKGESLGIVGESGCGKSSLGKTLMGLNKPTSGSMKFENRCLEDLTGSEWKPVYKDMSMIFQDPFSSLDPRMTVEQIVSEPLKFHSTESTTTRIEIAHNLLTKVGLSPADGKKYPHEFSGGQRQRIGIARALVTSPKLVIADEPVAALDVSVQAQVLNLLKQLQQEMELTLIFISHDLSVVRYLCDRIAVMYLGKVVEVASKAELHDNPQHPYTKALLSAIPPEVPWEKKERQILKGDVPSPMNIPAGCRFHTRCNVMEDRCRKLEPESLKIKEGHLVCCHLAKRDVH